MVVEYEWASDLSKRASKCEMWLHYFWLGGVCVANLSKTGRAYKMEVALIWHFVHAEQRVKAFCD